SVDVAEPTTGPPALDARRVDADVPKPTRASVMTGDLIGGWPGYRPAGQERSRRRPLAVFFPAEPLHRRVKTPRIGFVGRLTAGLGFARGGVGGAAARGWIVFRPGPTATGALSRGAVLACASARGASPVAASGAAAPTPTSSPS